MHNGSNVVQRGYCKCRAIELVRDVALNSDLGASCVCSAPKLYVLMQLLGALHRLCAAIILTNDALRTKLFLGKYQNGYVINRHFITISRGSLVRGVLKH